MAGLNAIMYKHHKLVPAYNNGWMVNRIWFPNLETVIEFVNEKIAQEQAEADLLERGIQGMQERDERIAERRMREI